MNCQFCGVFLNAESESSFKFTFVLYGNKFDGLYCNPQEFVSHMADCGLSFDNRNKEHREPPEV